MCGCCLSNSVSDKNLNSSLFGVPKTQNYNFNSLQVIDKNSKTCDYKKRYEYISTIGDGAFGLVRLFKDRECGLKYAIKTIKKDYINKYMIESLMREIDILSSLDHPNIVKYFETYEDSNYLHIVMEYIPGDNLFKMISNKKTIHFTEKDIHEIFVFLIKAVTFLHHNGIVHRDLKPENILFSVPGDYSSLKLIDFGLSIQRNLKTQAYRVGTPYYMAPEMIDGKYYFRSDVWSIGVILYTMITGSLPFNGSDKDEVFHKISLGIYDKKKLKEQNCSDELKDLIEKSLIVDRNKRITSDEILQHKWFKLFTKNPDYNTVLSPDIINALKNFQNQNVLQKEILYYLAKISTESEVVKLREAFSLIDEDNSGEIEYNDIPKVFQSLGIQATDEELKKIFDSLDFHHDGKVNYCEFIAATLSSIKFARKERLRSAFRYFDVSDQGYITADGIVEVLKKTKHIVNKDELIKIFSGLKGQKIEYEEFKKIFYETKAIPT